MTGNSFLMAKRPKSHATGDVAANHVSSIFLEAGWTCDPVRSDYGEDLAVRVFEDEQATAKFLFVQSKGTDDPIDWDKYGCHRLPLGATAIALWRSFRVPVIVTLYDRQKRIAYWQCVQMYFDALPRSIADDARSVLISRDRELTSASIPQLETIATDFFEMADKGYLYWIQEQLRTLYGLDVDLGEGEASFWPSGHFVPDGGLVQANFSGELARLVDELCEVTGRSPSDAIGKLLTDSLLQDLPGPSSRNFIYRGEFYRNWRVYSEVQSARRGHVTLYKCDDVREIDDNGSARETEP